MVTKLIYSCIITTIGFILAKELMVTKHKFFDDIQHDEFYSSERIDGNETFISHYAPLCWFYSSERIDGNETDSDIGAVGVKVLF